MVTSRQVDALVRDEPNQQRLATRLPIASLLFWGVVVCLFLAPSINAQPALGVPSLGGPTRISPDDGGLEWLFGSSIDATSRRLAVGSRWADGTQGAVYLYDRPAYPSDQPPVLVPVAKLLPNEGERNFGRSLAMHGDILAVVSSVGFRGAGAVDLYDLTGDATPIVHIPSPERASFFGSAIALNGEMLVVGTARADNELGAVHLYRRPAGGWGLLDPDVFTKLVTPEPQFDSSSRFGTSVAIDGETILVGAPFWVTESGEGALFVFEPPPGGWAGGTVTPSAIVEGPPDTDFGTSLSLRGDLLAVTAWGARDDAGDRTGAVHLFSRPGGGWADAELQASLTPSDPAHRAIFAASVTLAPGMVVVGAPGDPLGGYRPPGAAYLFLEPATGWQDHTGHEALKLISPIGTTGDRFGNALLGDDRTLFIAAFTDSGDGDRDRGAVYAYSLPLPSVVEVPGLSAWGAALLAAWTAFLGMRQLRRRIPPT